MRLFKWIRALARKIINRGSSGHDAIVHTVVGGIGPATSATVTPKPSTPPATAGSPVQLAPSSHGAEPFDPAAGRDMDHLMSGFVPKETLEKWIASGFLYPEEVRVAEKLIRTMRSPARSAVDTADQARLN